MTSSAPIRYKLQLVMSAAPSQRTPSRRRLTPSQRSLLIAMDEVVRRGFSKKAGSVSSIVPKRRGRGRPTKQEAEQRAADAARIVVPEPGELATGGLGKIRDALAQDWSCRRKKIDKIFERWGAQAEGLVRAILGLTPAPKLWHIKEALTEFSNAAPPPQALAKFAGQVVHTLPFNVGSYLKVHRSLGPAPSKGRDAEE